MHSVWKSIKMSYFKFFTNLIFSAKILMRVDTTNKTARSARLRDLVITKAHK